MQKIWLKKYPAGVPAEIDSNRFSGSVALAVVGRPVG